ncbi:putative metallophosphoesterase YhaO [Aquisphaera giovannonii]|uniref:Putative metallophosphoesterase YhaO n=1 Tax=Aquisphaera giovannonii TaxID=406548 RepID=A0A5B9W4S4_9BACT|nr:DNA repair exonuclease [Aquisphaera giovannonii]QEH35257.1 putative metallophosphoesterase YhaO [Aquisphaera giovannonii]
MSTSTFKFLHAADIHLDSPQLGLDRYEGAPVAECRGATRRALENLVALAVRERVAFVVIVGDLYDGDWPDYNTGLFFGKQMQRLREAGIKVYMIRGNHDAQNKMTRDLRLADNVTMFDADSPGTEVLDDLGVAIHAQSFARQAVWDNLAKAYPNRIAGCFNLGLLHTGVNGREGHDNYAPCTLEDLRTREYGYWALGHIHKREVLIEEDPWVVFPGNIQGRHARETGPKGCMLVTVDQHLEVASAEPRWLDVVRWETCRLDASADRDGDAVVARFQDELDARIAANDDRLLALRVEVSGTSEAHAALASQAARWTNEIRQAAIHAGDGRVWVEKVLFRTRPPRELSEELMADAPLAELAAFLDELRGDDARLEALRSRALDDLVRKLPAEMKEGFDSAARLRDLLDQVGPLLLDRLRRR